MNRPNILALLCCALFAFCSLNAQSSFVEYGKITYYGDKFQGRKTASGEKYDKKKYTCAHVSLPFGTMVKVTRLDNQKSVVVRVNDRGPFVKEFIIDISKKAALDIDLVHDGVAKVKIEVVTDQQTAEPTPATVAVKEKAPVEVKTPAAPVRPVLQEFEAPASSEKTAKGVAAKPTKTVLAEAVVKEPNEAKGALVKKQDFQNYGMYQVEMRQPNAGKFGVQAVTLTNFEYVISEIATMQGAFPGKILLNIEPGEEDKPMYKLVVGPFDTRKEADLMQKKVRAKGYKGAFSVEF